MIGATSGSGSPSPAGRGLSCGTCSGSPCSPDRVRVSLLIGELAFGAGTPRDANVKIGVLVGSLLSALLATVVLRVRNQHYRRLCADEERDDDADGIPDIYRGEQRQG